MLRPIAPFAALALAAIAAPPVAAQPAAADRFVGIWQGAIDAGGTRLRLGLEIARDSSGALRGVMTSIDQGSLKVPAAIVTRGDTLLVDMPAVQTRYGGVLTAEGDSVRGTFRQMGATLPLNIGRVSALATVARAQEPKPPFPYRTEEVTVESAPGVRLAATVIVPQGTGPFPGVVLVSGSGPQDRDGTMFAHRPFLVLADHLARHGIASLRFDERGVGRSTGSFASATSADFATDAEAAVHALQRQAGVARDRVGIVGHSEGGLVGPMVAARSRDVAFLVLLAGPGVPGDSLLMMQTRGLLAAARVDSATMARSLGFNRRIYDLAKSRMDSATLVARVRALAQEYVAALPAAERQRASPEALERGAAAVNTPWLRHFLTFDPRPTLRRVQVPVLAVGGSLDVQVPPHENLSAIEAALKAGGNRDHRTVVLPRLNHLFQTAVTGLPGEYGTLHETFAPSALELVTRWIGERFGRR